MMPQLKDRKKSRRKSGPPKCACGLEKEIAFEGDGVVAYPVFSCPVHGPDKRNEWALWWGEYKDRWRTDKFWDNHADKLSCLMGYFCHFFQKFYERPYTFAFMNPNPYRDKDFVMARRILTMFEWNAREAKVYIRWIFKKRIRNPKYAIHSLGFFASQQFVNEYLHAKARSKVLRRRTPLPKDFLDWCAENCPNIFQLQELQTWNDLNGLILHIKTYGEKGLENVVLEEAVRRNMLTDKYSFKKLEG